MQNNLNHDDKQVIIWFVILLIIFFYFIMPMLQSRCNADQKEMIERMTALNPCIETDSAKCSPCCCNINNQWPVPFKKCDKEFDKYISTNLTCSNGNNGPGCVCVTPKLFNSLKYRGGNKLDIDKN